MVNGLFEEVSEEEMVLTIGGNCGSGGGGYTISGINFNNQGVATVSGSNSQALGNAASYASIIAGAVQCATGAIPSGLTSIASGLFGWACGSNAFD